MVGSMRGPLESGRGRSSSSNINDSLSPMVAGKRGLAEKHRVAW